jgi:hypothetical protein
MKKFALGVFCFSLFITVVGFFLKKLLIPIQDFDTISQEELKNIQLDLAINYPLGTGMLYVGLPLLVCSSGYVVYCYFRDRKN